MYNVPCPPRDITPPMAHEKLFSFSFLALYLTTWFIKLMTLTLSILHPSPRLTTICNIYFWQRRKENRKSERSSLENPQSTNLLKTDLPNYLFLLFLFLLISSSCLTEDDHEHWIIVIMKENEITFLQYLLTFLSSPSPKSSPPRPNPNPKTKAVQNLNIR